MVTTMKQEALIHFGKLSIGTDKAYSFSVENHLHRLRVANELYNLLYIFLCKYLKIFHLKKNVNNYEDIPSRRLCGGGVTENKKAAK